MYPQIICHVMSSVDGRLFVDRWTEPFNGKSKGELMAPMQPLAAKWIPTPGCSARTSLW